MGLGLFGRRGVAREPAAGVCERQGMYWWVLWRSGGRDVMLDGRRSRFFSGSAEPSSLYRLFCFFGITIVSKHWMRNVRLVTMPGSRWFLHYRENLDGRRHDYKKIAGSSTYAGISPPNSFHIMK